MIDFSILFTAFLLGIFGSTHCIVMCGGLMSAMAVSNSRGGLIGWFNLGRVISYGLLGLIGGTLIYFLNNQWELIQQVLRWFAGTMLILMGLYINQWWKGLVHLEKIGKPIWMKLQPLVTKLLPLSSIKNAFIAGALWVFLPCGLIYSTLSWSISLNSPQLSGLAMLCFGIGTLPAVASISLGARQISQLTQLKEVSATFGLILMIFGVWTIAASGG